MQLPKNLVRGKQGPGGNLCNCVITRGQRGIEGVRNQQRKIVGAERGRIPLPELFYFISLLVLPHMGTVYI